MAVRNVAVLVLYNEKKEVLLQHRSKDAQRLPNYWAFFGGGIERGETPVRTLRREILEELEYEVSSPTLVFEQKFIWKDDENTKYVFVERYNQNKPLVQHEGQAMQWYALEDLSGLLMSNHDKEALIKIREYLESIN